MTESTVEDPALRQRMRFTRTASAAGEETLHVEIWVQPGGGVTPHVHPALEERFEVLDGQPSFLAGRRWRTAAPGETVVALPGVRHAYRNRSGAPAHMVCHASPPSTLQPFLEDAAALSRAGGITRQALPKSPSAFLQAAVMAHHYRDMVTLLFPPLPPPAIQRLIIPALARIGERRGYRAGSIARSGSATG